MQTDLFTENLEGRFCIHRSTKTLILVKKAHWFKGILNYDCLIPEEDEKGKISYCAATYSESEIELIGIQIEQI